MKPVFAASFCLLLASIAPLFAQDDAPIVHLGFENGFAWEGSTTGLTFNVTAEQCGAEAFPPGIVGKGFHRVVSIKPDVIIQGPIFNSSEGTFSFWGQPPDGWKNTDFNGPCFFRFFLPGQECLFYRIYGQFAVYESTGPQMTQMEDHFVEAGKWRMLTFVYKQGYRCLYVDDVPVFENRKAANDLAALAKGERYAKYLQTYGSPVYYDEVTTWDRPFAPGEVAALFYSRIALPKGASSVVAVPKGGAVELPLGYNGYTGGRISTSESVTLTAPAGTLGFECHLPLPKDYAAEKTRLGGSFFKSTAAQRDGDVFADDGVVVDLSPDGGATRYRFAANMAGVQHDAKNGDPAFNHPFTIQTTETNNTWVVNLVVPLAGLGEAPDGKWSFNFTRLARQAGLARHQVFYTRGAPTSSGVLQRVEPGAPSLRIRPVWDGRARTFTVDVEGPSSDPLTLEAQLEPLDHRTLFPDDKGVNVHRDKQPFAPVVKDMKTLTPASGTVQERLALNLSRGAIALATVTLKDSKGNLLFTDSGLAPCGEAGTLQAKYIPTQRKLYAEVTLPSAALLSHRTSAAFTLRAAGAKTALAAQRIEAFQKVSQETCFDLASRPVGDYEVEAQIEVDGQPSGTLNATMTKQDDPVWVGNSIGEMKEVPKPWTPVQVEKRQDVSWFTRLFLRPSAVSVWGRTYAFNRAFLPTSITDLGEELLAAPIRVTAEVNGQPATLTAGSVRIRPADRGGLRANVTGQGKLGALSATVAGWIEFDGFHFTRLDLKAPPGKTVTLNNVAIEIPMREEQATLYDIAGYEPIRIQAGCLPKAGVAAGAGSGQRLGTAERGLQWSLSLDPALIKPGSHTLRITPQGEQVLLKLVLANQPVTIGDSRSFEFGLQALPYRPYPRELRNYMLGAIPLDINFVSEEQRKTIVGWKHPMASLYTEGWSGKWNYLHLSEKALAERSAGTQSWFERGNTFPALYLNILLTDANTPEYAYYQSEWSPDGTSTPNLVSPTKLIKDYPGHDGKVEPSMGRCTVESKSYREFYYYWLDRVLTAYQSRPNPPPVWVYFDNSGFVEATNPYLGCDRKKPGNLDTLLAYRDYLKHVWTIVHGHGPRNYVTIHNSGARVAPAYAFCDVWIEGEQFSAHWTGGMMANDPKLTQNDCYPTVLSLDKVRAIFNPHVWTPYAFLSQFWNDARQKEDEYRATHPPKPGQPSRTPPSVQRRYRYLSGLMRVNDTSLWGELTPLLPTYTRMIDWGWDDQIEFIPYWDPRGAFEFSPGEPDKVAVSAWYRPDGKLVMCVFNGQKKPVTVNIQLHPDKFPVKLRSFSSVLDMTSPDPVFEEDRADPDTFPLQDGALRIPVRAEDYRFLRFDEASSAGAAKPGP